MIREIGIPISQLRRPSFIAGASGAGKTTLAATIALQHIHAGRGCAIIDPHNDFVDEVKTQIPKRRTGDVIEIDPGNLTSEYTHTLNFLDLEVEPAPGDYDEYVNHLVEDNIGVISNQAKNVGDRMKDTLDGLLRALIHSEEQWTYLNMRDILREEAERQTFARQMKAEGYEPSIEFAEDLLEMDPDELMPVKRLLNKWYRSRTARELIRHTDSSINFERAVKENKIILVRADLSDSLQQLISTAIFSKIWRAGRNRPRGDRPLYPIVMDEVDDIHTPEMDLESKIGNARKYGIGLTLMTQEPAKLQTIEETLKQNAKLFVAFACPSDTQSRIIARMFDCAESLVSKLGDFRALVQLDIDGERQGPFLTEMFAPYPGVRTDAEAEQEISIPSRRNYGIKRGSMAAEHNPHVDHATLVQADEPTRDNGEVSDTLTKDSLAQLRERIDRNAADEL